MYRLEQPDKKTLKQVVDFAEHGDVAVPNFQRYFRWSTKDIQELFESIFRGYYIGSFLFWRTNKRAELDMIPVFGTKIKREELNPRDLILDGQQRISSIYYVVKSPDEPLYNTKYPYVFYVNLKALLDEKSDANNLIESYPKNYAERKGLLDNNNLFELWLFPLFHLDDFFMWLDDFENHLEDHQGYSRNDARRIKNEIRERLNYVWDKYDIPIITLPEGMHLEHVAEIFERLNSKGIPLTVFDLLNARLLKYKIKLREIWESSLEEHKRIKEYSEENERIPVYIIQVISLLKKSACKRKDLLEIDKTYLREKESLDPKDFYADWNEACKFVERALERIMNLKYGFGVIAKKWLPYNPMIPVIGSLLKEIDNDQINRPNYMKKISIWYWSSVFSNAYEGSIDTQMANDFRDLKKWFADDDHVPETVKRARDLINDLNLREIDRASNSIYKGIMCLTALRGARDFLKGDAIEFNALDDHHLFPKSKAKRYGAKREINSILNKSLIDLKTNRDYIWNRIPKEYLTKIMKDQNINVDVLSDRLKTHLISRNALNKMLNDDFSGFLEEREKTIKEEIRKLLEIF